MKLYADWPKKGYVHHQRNQSHPSSKKILEKIPVLEQGKDKFNVEYLAVPESIKVLKK